MYVSTQFICLPPLDAASISLEEHHAGYALVCKSGTHRSVGLARLALECLMRDGFKVNSPKHLSHGTWTARNRCHWCYNCKLDSPGKPKLFDTVYKWWQAI